MGDLGIDEAKAEDGGVWQRWCELRDWCRPFAVTTIGTYFVIAGLTRNWTRETVLRKIIGFAVKLFHPDAEVFVVVVKRQEKLMENKEDAGDAGRELLALEWLEERGAEAEAPQEKEEVMEEMEEVGMKIAMEDPVESPWAPSPSPKRRRKHVTFAEEIVEVKYFKPESPKKWLLRNTRQRRLTLEGMSEEELEDKETVMRGSPKSPKSPKGGRKSPGPSGGGGRSSVSGKGRKRLGKSPSAESAFGE